MATNTFDRRIELNDVEAVKKLIQILSDDTPQKPLSEHPFSSQDRERSERLLKQFLSRSDY